MIKYNVYQPDKKGSVKKDNEFDLAIDWDEIITNPPNESGTPATMYDYKQGIYYDRKKYRMNNDEGDRSQNRYFFLDGPVFEIHPYPNERDENNDYDTSKVGNKLIEEFGKMHQDDYNNWGYNFIKEYNLLTSIAEHNKVVKFGKKDDIYVHIDGYIYSRDKVEDTGTIVKTEYFKQYSVAYKMCINVEKLDAADKFLVKHPKYSKLQEYFDGGFLSCVVRIFDLYDLNSTNQQHRYFQKIYFYRKLVNIISAAGCLVTCMADVVSFYGYQGKNNITPSDVDKKMDEMDKSAGDDESKRGHLLGKADMATINVAREYKLNFSFFPEKISTDYYTKKDESGLFQYEKTEEKQKLIKKIDDRLKENKPTIAFLKNRESDGGHFVVIVGTRYLGGIPKFFITNEPGLSQRKRAPELDENDEGLINYETLEEFRGDKRPVARLNLLDK